MTNQSMKAAIIKHYSEDYDVFKYENVVKPEPGVGELLIKVQANGVNHCDTDLRKGLFGVDSKMPHVMGVDAVGEVCEVGEGVVQYVKGDRVSPHFMLSCGICSDCINGKENFCSNAEVLGVTVWGGYAEYVRCGQNHVVRIPDNLSSEDAVAGQVPFATAWEALIEVARVRVGENVLITAAGGGVGTAGLQIAKLSGARVIAAAGDDRKLDRAREYGADETIPSTLEFKPTDTNFKINVSVLGITNLNTINFGLIDSNGVSLNMNGVDWCATIQVRQIPTDNSATQIEIESLESFLRGLGRRFGDKKESKTSMVRR